MHNKKLIMPASMLIDDSMSHKSHATEPQKDISIIRNTDKE
jgi:hypothetical protein